MLALAIALEEGRFDGPVARACSRAWALVSGRMVVRRLELPSGTRVVAIGGSTLGGSGKTPLAIACAIEVAATGARVALEGHAYRARPMKARVVTPDAPRREVGDEALVAARALAGTGVAVIVGPSRREALGFASRTANVLVLDGVAQTAPRRADLALLAVDATEPWGRAGAVAPLGDLRASKDELLRACDGVVWIGDPTDHRRAPADDVVIRTAGGHIRRASWAADTVSTGARVGGEYRGWGELVCARVGLLCALGRPYRVVRWLATRGVEVRCVVRAVDHGPVTQALLARAARAQAVSGIDLWLATGKCASHFETRDADGRHADSVGSLLRAPLGVIDHAIVLPGTLRERLRRLGAP